MFRTKGLVALAMVLLLVAIPILGACTKEVIKEVEVEVPVVKEVIKEVPVETIVEKEVTVEKIVRVPVKKVVEKEVIVEVPVDKVVERVVEVQTASTKPEGDLVVAVPSLGNERYLPWLSAGGIELNTSVIVYETPLSRDPWNTGSEAYPWLAEKWKLSEDALNLQIWLREGIQFHDSWGEVTTEDVKFSWDQMMADDSKSRTVKSRVKAGNIKLVVEGPYKYHFQAEGETLLKFMSYLQSHMVPIVSKKYVEAVGDEAAAAHPIGTGAWRFVQHSIGDYIKFEAVEDHYRQTPAFKYLTIKVVPEEATRLAMLKTGEADIIDLTTLSAVEAEEAGFKLWNFPASNTVFVNLTGQYLPDRENYNPNTNADGIPWVGPLGDENALKVRKALNLAVDTEAILEHFFLGTAQPLRVPIFPWHDPQNDPAWEPYPYDPDQAKQLLAEAGYPNGFDVTLWGWTASGRPEGPAIAELVSIYWEAIGINVSLERVEYAGVKPGLRARAALGNTANVYLSTDSYEPYSFIASVGWSKGSTLLFVEYPELDAIMAKLVKETDYDRRFALQREWGQIVYDNYLGVPIATKQLLAASNDRIGEWGMGRNIYLRNFEYATHGTSFK